jgi:hypothetical protein
MRPMGQGEEVARWYMRAALVLSDWKVNAEVEGDGPKRKVWNMLPHLPRGLTAIGIRTMLASRSVPIMSLPET